MINITIIDQDNNEHKIELDENCGLNLMEVCKTNDIDVEGVCGGMALCATCHCLVESNHKLEEKQDAEIAMLNQCFNLEKNSRLSCQIQVSKEIDGLNIRLIGDY
tara:strand:+ start:290 stop:604 length:315 start_codon:yes stop_codon:yes gene_type:complete